MFAISNSAFQVPFLSTLQVQRGCEDDATLQSRTTFIEFPRCRGFKTAAIQCVVQSETESDKACQTSISLVPNKSRTQSHKIDLSRTYSQINMNLQTALSGILGSQVSLPIAISLPGLHWSSSFLHDYSSPQCMDLTKFTVVIVNTLCNLR